MNEEKYFKDTIENIAEIIYKDWGINTNVEYTLVKDYEKTARKILNYLKEKDVAMIFY